MRGNLTRGNWAQRRVWFLRLGAGQVRSFDSSVSCAGAHSHHEFFSALGVYDGKVYEALWNRAQQDPLNKSEVPEAYEKSIRPILLRGQKQVGLKHAGKAKL